jgi:hypothetical protein
MTSRTKTLENLRDRQNKRYNEARNEWVEGTSEREYVAPTVSASVLVGGEEDEALAAALGIKSVSEVASLDQRFLELGQQGTATADLWPAFTNLVAKRSKRCRECQHNLIKPELNPNSIKFKMQLFASQHVPTLRIATVPELLVGEPAEVVLCLVNPLDHPLTITITPLDEAAAAAAAKAAAKEAAATAVAAVVPAVETVTEGEATSTPDAPAADVEKPAGAAATDEEGSAPPKAEGESAADGAAKPSMADVVGAAVSAAAPTASKPLNPLNSIVSKQNVLGSNAELTPPPEPLVVAEHDPVQEYGMNEAAESKYTDDPDVIVKRLGNTLYFKMMVTPKQPGVVTAALALSYTYSATVPGLSRAAGALLFHSPAN